MRWLGYTVTCAIAIAVGTWAVAWWIVPIVAAVGAWVWRDHPWVGLATAAAGSLGWGLLLGVAALQGPVGQVAAVVGDILGVAPSTVVGFSLLYPALLAGSAAILVTSVARRRPAAAPVRTTM